MGVTVSYYSFSPSRADKAEPPAAEELRSIQEELAINAASERASVDLTKARDELDKKFAPRLVAARNRIIDYAEKLGFYIPREEWHRPAKFQEQMLLLRDRDSQIEYLTPYGALYRKGVVPPKEGAEYIFMQNEAPELLDAYEKVTKEFWREDASLQTHMQSAWTTKPAVLPALSVLEPTDVVRALRSRDLERGALSVVVPEGKLDDIMRQHIFQAYDFPDDREYVPSKEQLIKIFRSLSKERMEKINQGLQTELGWDWDDADAALLEYLQAVREIALDLRDTPDAIFAINYDFDDKLLPASAEQVLEGRAEHRLQELKRIPQDR